MHTFRRHLFTICMGFAVAGFAAAQENTEGTRQMYYLATPAQDSVPPIPPKGAATSSPSASTLHLGLRYNLVLMGEDGKPRSVASDYMFKEGDCFAMELQANRAGYLYVLARQSSGSWTPLTDMPGQQKALPPGKHVRIPEGSCFVVHNPAGTETFFLVLSRDPRDFLDLYDGIKAANSTPPRSGSETKMASTEKIDAAVQHLDEKFGGSRDITIARIDEPARKDEPAGAVYVVNTSQKPTSSLVTKILVRHN